MAQRPRTSLRRRTLTQVGAIFIALAFGLFLVSAPLMLSGFLALERRQLTDHAERAGAALQREIENIHTKAVDWATWDDCFQFAQDHNARFIEANLEGDGIAALGIDLLCIFDSRRHLVESRSIGSTTRETIPLPDGFAQILTGDGALGDFDTRVDRAGLLQLNGRTWFISVRPILPTSGDGEPSGTLIFAAAVNDARVEQIARLVRVPVELVELTSPRLDSVDPGLVGRVIGGVPGVRAISLNRVEGWFAVRDLMDRPLLLGRVESPRRVLWQGIRSQAMLLGCLGTLVPALYLLMRRSLGRLVLDRIAAMHETVVGIGRTGELSMHVRVEGDDELAEFGESFNHMVERLARTQAQLRDAMHRAEAAARAKSAFLANMSHEIRTPMTAVLGFADLLEDRSIDDVTRAAHVATIRRNGDHLLAVVNDILDYSKIEAGRFQLDPAEFNLPELLRDVAQLHQMRAEEKSVHIVVELARELPAMIVADPTRLRQVVHNLVSNAVKFTVAGAVTLSACVDDQRLRIEVSDTGIGIDPELMPLLFAPFSQGDTSMSRRFGGTGLGLAISRSLAELMGGTLEVRSSAGHGATFTLRLPLVRGGAAPAPAAAVAAVTEADARRLTGLRVLVAEDGPDNQRLIRFVLERAGAEVVSALNGREAIEAALAPGAVGFDVILMDMQMPELDGYSATARLRDAGCRVPIVALTAHALSSDRDACLAAGCDEYQSKPIDRFRLLATILRVAQRVSPTS